MDIKNEKKHLGDCIIINSEIEYLASKYPDLREVIDFHEELEDVELLKLLNSQVRLILEKIAREKEVRERIAMILKCDPELNIAIQGQSFESDQEKLQTLIFIRNNLEHKLPLLSGWDTTEESEREYDRRRSAGLLSGRRVTAPSLDDYEGLRVIKKDGNLAPYQGSFGKYF